MASGGPEGKGVRACVGGVEGQGSWVVCVCVSGMLGFSLSRARLCQRVRGVDDG